jgi:hypothetical protein
MKKTLLFTCLIVTQLMSAQYYISELVASPPNNSGVFNDYTDTPLPGDFEYAPDDTLEYFEFRGTPGETIPADVYFIAVDGDDENPGRIQDAVELSGLTFGSNGILVIVSNLTFDTGSLHYDGTTDISGVKITNPYASALQNSDATVETLEFVGIPAWVDEGGGKFELDRVNGVSSIRGYDGTIIDQSATYMIIQTTAGEGNPDGEEIDADANGVLDGLAENWTIYDGVSILDDDDDVEFAYSNMIFIEEPDAELPLSVTLTHDPALSPSIIPLNQYPQYVARQGLKTGNSATLDGVNNDDWMAGRINSRSYPDWDFSSNVARNFPTSEVTGNSLSEFNGLTLGEVNVDFDTSTASVDEVFSSEISIYPNPASQFINIESNSKINKVEVFNLLGKRVLSTLNFKNNLDISSLSKGMYMLKLTSGKSVGSKKLIIK